MGRGGVRTKGHKGKRHKGEEQRPTGPACLCSPCWPSVCLTPVSLFLLCPPPRRCRPPAPWTPCPTPTWLPPCWHPPTRQVPGVRTDRLSASLPLCPPECHAFGGSLCSPGLWFGCCIGNPQRQRLEGRRCGVLGPTDVLNLLLPPVPASPPASPLQAFLALLESLNQTAESALSPENLPVLQAVSGGAGGSATGRRGSAGCLHVAPPLLPAAPLSLQLPVTLAATLPLCKLAWPANLGLPRRTGRGRSPLPPRLPTCPAHAPRLRPLRAPARRSWPPTSSLMWPPVPPT